MHRRSNLVTNAAGNAVVALVVASMLSCASSVTSQSPDSSPIVVAPTATATTATVAPMTTLAPTTGPATTGPVATQAPPITVTTTTTTIPVTTTTTAPNIETREIGRSVQGRPIIATRRGTPGGRVVLVIGVIHGDEDDGLAILERLHRREIPDGIDLWLVDSMNPDGVAAATRLNANGVDLNRNFPYNWSALGDLGDWQYAGPAAASEPETQAMVSFITEIRPDIVMWYHQDYFRIAPSTGRDGAVRARYAELTGIPLLSISGGTYTGVAATWARRTLSGSVAFIVELGATLSDGEADTHADAVLTIAAESN